ncbi:MAG: TonB-dependent receptor [Candidatus Zixiibacteriota bacterium]
MSELNPKLECLLVIVCLSLIPAIGAYAQDSAFSVRGRVIDSISGQPIANATVRLRELSWVGKTDDDGRFECVAMAPGPLTVAVTHVAYDSLHRTVLIRESMPELIMRLHPRSIQRRDVVVTATPIEERAFNFPQNVSVTTEEDIDRRTATTTAEILREEPGILVQKTTHGHGAPIIRGLIGRYVLLLYDGVRLNKPNFRFGGNQYLNTVDRESLDRVEVVRGPTSVHYGSDAIGGVVNMIPDSPVLKDSPIPVRVGATARYASADKSHNVSVAATGGLARLSAHANVSVKSVGDLRAGDPIGLQSPTGWNEWSAAGRAGYLLSPSSRLWLDLQIVRQNEVPRYDRYVSGAFTQWTYDPQDRDLAVLRLESAIPQWGLSQLKANVSFQREAEGRTEQRTGSREIAFSKDGITTWGGAFRVSRPTASIHLLALGAEAYHDRIDSWQIVDDGETLVEKRPTYPDNSKYSQIGVFAEDRITLSEHLTVTAGVRYSIYRLHSPLGRPFGDLDDSYDDVTGALFVSYEPVPELNLIGSWSRGFRAPNLNDVAVLGFSSSGVDAPSPDLGAERSDNFELGVKLQSSRVSGQLFGFYNRLDDLIDRVPGTYDGKAFFDENGNGVQDEGEFDIFQRDNIGRARLYGFEFSATSELTQHLQARLQAFWTRGEEITANDYMSRIPPFMGLTGVAVNLSEHWRIEFLSRWAVAQRHLSQRDLDDSRIDPNGTPGWVTYNVRVQVGLKPVSVYVGLENLTDEDYKEHGSGVYSSGRGITAALRYSTF